MMQSKSFVELYLTCADQDEVERITDALLAAKLVACVKFEPVHSKFWWQGKLDESDEVKVSMLSIADNFTKIEGEVAKLHSYETFVLQATPIAQLSAEAAKWLDETVTK